MSRRFETYYRVKRRDNLGEPDYWNTRLEDIDRRIDSNETALENVDDVANRIEATALQRLDLVVTPLVEQTRERLRSLADIFVSSSTTRNTVNKENQFFVVPESDRLTFATLGYVIADAIGGEAGMGGPVQSFDTDTGTLVISVDYTWGSGSFDGWILTGSPPINAIVAAADPVIRDRVTLIGNAIAADAATQIGSVKTDAVSRIAAAQAQVQAVADSRLPKDGSQPMTGVLRAKGSVYIDSGAGEQNLVWTRDNVPQSRAVLAADGTLYFHTAMYAGDKYFGLQPTGDIAVPALGGAIKPYVDRGIRSDVLQGLGRPARLIAKNNISVETGRRYYTGQPNNKVFVSVGDIGSMVYLESDITALEMPLAANYTDGDYVWLYARGTVNVTVAAGDPYSFGWGQDNSGSFVMRPGDRCKLSLGADAWNVMSYSTRRDKALVVDRPLTFSDAEKQQLYSNADIALPFCGGTLVCDSGTQLALRPDVNNKIFINGNYRTIPTAGVIVSNAGLAPGGAYYVFAYWDVGSQSIKLSIGIGAPTTDPMFGHQVANIGTAAQNRVYTLVGYIWVDGNATFRNDSGRLGVLNWYNKRALRAGVLICSPASSSSGAFTPLGNYMEALCWGTEVTRFSLAGYAYGDRAGTQTSTTVWRNGAAYGPVIINTHYAGSAASDASFTINDKFPQGAQSFNAGGIALGGVGGWVLTGYVEVMG